MAEERPQRRLAAILAADVLGFSRLMEADEAGTLAVWKSRRREVLDPLVAKHQGRIFKTTGDGVLVEFGSAVNAVQCAVDLQQGMAAANDGHPEDRRIILRIGVNLGDVMVEGSDLYGDGVNIAARLEALADPGGILVSGTSHDHVGTRVKVGFEDMGVQALKNIAQPVRTYRVTNTQAPAVVASKPATDKPSIAVLPFTNMSSDPEHQYFSDGITDDIITELSRFRSLFVIARNSSFQFRSSATDLAEVRRKLGVRFVVEGSVRRMGERLRITAQLINVETGGHLWAEKYDGDLRELFAVQDDIVRAIVSTVEGRIAAGVAQGAAQKTTPQMLAYDYMLRGREAIYRQDGIAAEGYLRRAIEIDPDFAEAHAWLSGAMHIRSFYRDVDSASFLAEALTEAQKAVACDNNNSFCHATLGSSYKHLGQFGQAAVHLDRSIMLNPNNITALALKADLLTYTGKPDLALEIQDTILRRDPYPPSWYWEGRGIALYDLRRYDEAIISFMNTGVTRPWHHAELAAANAMAERHEDAKREMSAYRQLEPAATLEYWSTAEPYRDRAQLEHILEGLRKAGLPE
jgi:adenylate cyclase